MTETFIAIPDLAERLEVEVNLRAELRQQIHDLADENRRVKIELDYWRKLSAQWQKELAEARGTISDLKHDEEFLRIWASARGYDLVKRPEVESKGETIAKAMEK